MSSKHKTLGIIGGLGPMATAYFMEMLTNFTDAQKDQDHIKMLVYSNPKTPDRTAFVLNKSSEDPMPFIHEAAVALEDMGAEVLAIPCITAHCFHSRLIKDISTTVINAVEETVLELKKDNAFKVGIMATDGTLTTGLFQSALEKAGITPIEPDDATQRLIMSVIYDDIKTGRDPSQETCDKISGFFESRGADAVILGCTELSLLKRSGCTINNSIDAMEVLAKRTVELCGYELRRDR